MPLQFIDGFDRKRLYLTGRRKNHPLVAMQNGLRPGQQAGPVGNRHQVAALLSVEVLCRIDTSDEVAYYEAGGILQYVLNKDQELIRSCS